MMCRKDCSECEYESVCLLIVLLWPVVVCAVMCPILFILGVGR